MARGDARGFAGSVRKRLSDASKRAVSFYGLVSVVGLVAAALAGLGVLGVTFVLALIVAALSTWTGVGLQANVRALQVEIRELESPVPTANLRRLHHELSSHIPVAEALARRGVNDGESRQFHERLARTWLAIREELSHLEDDVPQFREGMSTTRAMQIRTRLPGYLRDATDALEREIRYLDGRRGPGAPSAVP